MDGTTVAETDQDVETSADETPEDCIHIVWRLSKYWSALTRSPHLTLCRIPMHPEYWKRGDNDPRLVCKTCLTEYKALGGLVRLRG